MRETPVLTKAVNFLVADVQLNRASTEQVMNIAGGGDVGAIACVLEAFRKAYGGLWVGGRLTIIGASIQLSANTMNRELQHGAMDIVLPLSSVRAVEVEGGFLTKIVRLDTGAGSVKFRSFGGKAVAAMIEKAILAAPVI